ncbi:MAG: hypothetical protein GY803_27495, partial [Chloroflexi bacterium]|nr:hypothetical protein [Chloroflexota bacterium]
DFVGKLTHGDTAVPPFDYNHEGHAGWHADHITRSNILGNIHDWLTDNPADVVLLHIGTNDILDGQDAVSLAPEVDQILDEIDRFDENTTVILAQIINMNNSFSTTVTAFNSELLTMAQGRIAAGDKIIVVDHENALDYPADLLNDGVHPKPPSGYEKMSAVWLAALEDFMPVCTPEAPVITSSPTTETYVGQPYDYTVTASGYPPPTYTLVTAPIGMTIITATGVISWIPTITETVSVTVEAHNSSGFDSQSFTITVTEQTAVSPLITTNPSTQISVGQTYTYDVDATGDPVPTYTFAVSPPGMTIDEATGAISWAPTTTGTFDVIVEARNAAGFEYQAYMITVNPLATCDQTAYWLLDETSGTVYDDVIGRHDAECVGDCPSFVSGLVGGAQQFTIDKASVIDVSPSPDFDWGMDDSFSIEFWIQTVAGETCESSSEVVIGRDDEDGPHWWIGCSNGGKAKFTLLDSQGNGVEELLGSPIGDGAWHHIVGVRNGVNDTNYLYVDGALAVSATHNYTSGFESDTSALNIGWFNHHSNPKKFNIKGTVDELAIYGRSLTPAEIESHYNYGLAGAGYCNPLIEAPAIISAPTIQVGIGQPYTYNVEANGYPSPTYALRTSPSGMNIMTDTGVISWTPMTSGVISVTVEAKNIAGVVAQGFFITVTQAPAINSTPVTEIGVNQSYSYDVDATGFPTLTYALTAAPSSMMIDPDTGVISWLPGEIGEFAVTVVATNSVGSNSQSFSVTVTDVPAITSTPVTAVHTQQPYQYAVQATGYPTPTFSLTTFPAGMTIDAGSGLISWTPDDDGVFPVEVKASSLAGTAVQNFDITVSNYTVFLPVIIR